MVEYTAYQFGEKRSELTLAETVQAGLRSNTVKESNTKPRFSRHRLDFEACVRAYARLSATVSARTNDTGQNKQETCAIWREILVRFSENGRHRHPPVGFSRSQKSQKPAKFFPMMKIQRRRTNRHGFRQAGDTTNALLCGATTWRQDIHPSNGMNLAFRDRKFPFSRPTKQKFRRQVSEPGETPRRSDFSNTRPT